MFQLLLPVAKSLFKHSLGGIAIKIAKTITSEEVERQALAEANEEATTVINNIRVTVIWTIVWQNAVLLLSIGLAYLLKTPWSFYVAYGLVTTYTMTKLWEERRYIVAFIRERSLLKIIEAEVLSAVQSKLENLGFVKRNLVQYLGPDIHALALRIARHIFPTINAALINLVLTSVAAFVVFRLMILPALSAGIVH